MTPADRHESRISFPTAQPEGAALAHVEIGAAVGGVVTWTIQTLNVGPLRSSTAYERHLQNTVGSSYDWSDEVRFDKQTGRLSSFILKTPEAGLVDSEVAATWLGLPVQHGIPVLDDRENGFHIDPLDLRFLASDGSALVVTDAGLPGADPHALRLEIATDVDLLFHRGRYRGWILRNPVAHLVAEPGDKPSGPDDPRVHAVLLDYLTLVVQPNIDRMSDEDPAMRVALQELRNRVQAVDTAQARALESAIARVLEVFYPS